MAEASSPRRNVILSEHITSEQAQALSAVGLIVRRGGDPAASDVLLVDPTGSSHGRDGLEQLVAVRAGALLAKVGDSVPDLYAAVMEQAERGLFRAVLAHTTNHLGRASKILGLDRNTCARKARAFGLVSEPSRGRKPGTSKTSKSKKASAAKSHAGKRAR
jgi:DNA-binding protein Fis